MARIPTAVLVRMQLTFPVVDNFLIDFSVGEFFQNFSSLLKCCRETCILVNICA